MSKKRSSPGKKILRILLYILSSIFLVTAVLGTYSRNYLLNIECYKEEVVSGGFEKAALAEFDDCVQDINAIVTIDTQKIEKMLDYPEFLQYVKKYTSIIIADMINGTETEIPEYAGENLRKNVAAEIETYCKENDIVFVQEDIDEICDYVEHQINATAEYIPVQFVNYGSKITKVFSAVSVIAKLEVPFYMLSVLVIVINFAFFGRKNWKRILFGTSASGWLIFCTVTAPLFLISMYNIPARMVLGESMLYYLIKGICALLFTKSSVVFFIGLALFTAALIFSISLLCSTKTPQKKYRMHYLDDNDKIAIEEYE